MAGCSEALRCLCCLSVSVFTSSHCKYLGALFLFEVVDGYRVSFSIFYISPTKMLPSSKIKGASGLNDIQSFLPQPKCSLSLERVSQSRPGTSLGTRFGRWGPSVVAPLSLLL